MMAEADLIARVADALARQPGGSMQEIAAAAGVGRTTLHRAFGSREALIEGVGRHVLAECARLFDAAGIDDAPADEVLDRLIAETVLLARVYALLFAEPAVYRATALQDDIAGQEQRFERFVVRCQAAGVLRLDVPPGWLANAIGAQLGGAWWAIQEGHVGVRDAPRLLRTTLFDGIAGAAARP